MNQIQQGIEAVDNALATLAHEAASIWVLIQFALILLAAVVALLLAAQLRRRFDLSAYSAHWPTLLRLWLQLFETNLPIVIFALLAGLLRELMLGMTLPEHSYLLSLLATLATGWVVIALAAGAIRNQFVYRLVVGFAWLIWAGYVVGWRQTIRAALNSFGVELGGVRVTPLLLIKVTVLLLLTLWAANTLADFLEKRVRGVADLTPSIQVLVNKLIRLVLLTFAVLIVLSSVGIDFSSLAFFSGAIGVGVGFGLQKIVSNLVSGIILLADKSIKPGDVISLGDSYGWVTSMGARYTAVVTRDGREHLIPNEDFVTQRVINWSYSNNEVRIDVEFGTSYHSDPHRVIALALEAAKSVRRVLEKPAPVCSLKAFGDSSLNFVLRFWINDPVQGLTNVHGQVLLALWDAFKREGIEIPFPQRDLNPRGPFRVVVERETDAP
jgi:small-conductance mechanosensitive channel